MNVTDDITLQNAAKQLDCPPDLVKRVAKDVLGKEPVMLSQKEIELLQTHILEKSNEQAGGGRPRRANSVLRGKQPATVNRSRSNVLVEQRKVRGRKPRDNRLARPAAPAETPPEPPAVEPSPPPPPPPPPPPAVARQPQTAAPSETVNRRQSRSVLDALEEKKSAPPPPAKEPAPAAPPVEKPVEKPAAKEADKKPEQLEMPQPVGTIRINKDKIARRNQKRKLRRAAKVDVKHEFVQPVEPKALVVEVPEEISIKELAVRMAVKTRSVLDKVAQLSDGAEEDPDEMMTLDQDTAVFIVDELGHRPEKVYENQEDEYIVQHKQASGKEKVVRPPVVTVMGHVDHGKTSLLDYIRKARVVDTESGGITQHIGAYQVETADAGRITFIDTPGHEVFTEMRARGANITDIVVLVVAADDGVQPQTREAIAHAKAAAVPIIVAVNKMDLPDAKTDRVLQELAGEGLQAEEWGGQTIVVPVSAMTGDGVDKLLESIHLTAEIAELEESLDVSPSGVVIEARTDKGLGPVVSAIVKKGVLRKGDYLLCESEYGKVRAMRDENGKLLDEAPPSTPVQIQGVASLPRVGCEFFATDTEARARSLATEKRDKVRARQLASTVKVVTATSLDQLLEMAAEEEQRKILNLVVKTDVAGTCEAMVRALQKIGNDEACTKIVYSGVGPVTETDVLLAHTSEAIIVGFRVVANAKARRLIEQKKVVAMFNDVFYEVTDRIKGQVVGMLEPARIENVRGKALVKEVFHIKKVGKIAGCSVEEGTITTKMPIKVVRDGVVVGTYDISELRHYKDQASKVDSGSDCGICLARYSDFKPGDVLESIEVKIEAKTL